MRSVRVSRVGLRVRSLRGVAWVSVLLLVVSGLSLSALTAGIEVAPTAIGPPEHRFADDGTVLPAGAESRRDGIPRAAFERVRAIPARGPAAFGGDRIYDVDVDGTSYRVHEFTTVGSSSLVVTRPLTVEYLVVGGGGGGGGGHAGGGGGGGGHVVGAMTLPSGPTVVTVGAGGGAGREGPTVAATAGGASTLADVTAAGGGAGGQAAVGPGGSGASGGGAAGSNLLAERAGGAGIAGQGSAGGTGSNDVGSGYGVGGGGGGASQAGAAAVTNGGKGGDGATSSITGVPVVRAGGGGGGGWIAQGRTGGSGGAGGGGAGSSSNSSAGAGGVAGTGGGGGGGEAGATDLGRAGGEGGSGIVIVRYPIPRGDQPRRISATGGTVTQFIGDGTNGGDDGVVYRVHTFRSTGVLDLDARTAESDRRVEYLIVAGGGGGGFGNSNEGGGGGGAGGLRTNVGNPTVLTVSAGAVTVTVGTGGAGATGTGAAGANGTNSGFDGITATGGGGGGSCSTSGSSGGSGGGGSGCNFDRPGGPGTAGQGNSGGTGRWVGTSPGNGNGGGGGGAGGAGGNGADRTAGTTGGAGIGLVSRIDGTTVTYAGGGDGFRGTGNGVAATGRDGLGEGGGGSAQVSAARGGNGVVIVRYPVGRRIDAIPSEVRELVAGEGRTTAVLRWRAPELSPPSPDAGGYRIEYSPLNGSTWTAITDGVFSVDPGDAGLISVALPSIPSGAPHRFRITPIGTVDGPSRTVDPIAKGGDVVTLVGDDVVHQFTAVGAQDFTLLSERTVTALAVGGGASGTRGQCSLYWGHGGGGGGVSRESLILEAGAFVATVGGGGPGSTTQTCESEHTGAAGGVSTLASPVATLLVATGGSGAGSQQARGGTAGTGIIDGVASGGHLGGIGSGGISGCPGPSACGAGGGGGAGGAGSGDVGGAGLASSVTGAEVVYGRGGAGRTGGVFGAPGLGPQGPGGGGTDQNGGGYTAGNAGTVVLRYAFAPSAPSAPSGVSGTPEDGAVSLTWDAPTFTGGSPILDYEIGRSTDGGATWSDWDATGSTDTAVTVSGLTNGTAYVFRVRALNAIGASDASAPSSAVTPRTVPGAPLISSVTGGDTTLDVVFSVPSDGGATITNVEYRIDDGPWITRSPASAASPLTLTGLENDRAYTVRLRAINAVGTGAESASATGTPIEGFIADFVGGQAPGVAIEAAWAAYRASLTGSYDSFTFSSSLGGSVTVTHPTEVQKLANGLRTGTATSVTIDGVVWVVGTNCRQGAGPNVELSNVGTCTGQATAALRPDINNLNWGGIGSTVSQPSQRLTLVFRRTLP